MYGVKCTTYRGAHLDLWCYDDSGQVIRACNAEDLLETAREYASRNPEGQYHIKLLPVSLLPYELALAELPANA